jgi:hypothetical protein
MAVSFIEEIKGLDIVGQRDKQVTAAMSKIRPILSRMEKFTLRFLTGVHPITLHKFTLPLQPLLRREIRDFFQEAYRAGSGSRRNSEIVRAKADMVFNKIVADIENELKLGWSHFSGRGKNKKLLEYHTRLVFANLADREPPSGI